MDWNTNWTLSLQDAFNEVVVRVGSFLPNLLFALLLLLLGWLIASMLGRLVSAILDRANVDTAAENVGVKSLFNNAGITLSISGLVGWLVKWFIMLIFLIAVAETLNLQQISNFINQIASYIPNVIAAAVILIIGAFVANTLGTVVENTSGLNKVISSTVLANLVRWSIIVFTFLASLSQLNIAKELIQTLFTGIIAALSLAFALAFGLGGREQASRLLERWFAVSGGTGRRTNNSR